MDLAPEEVKYGKKLESSSSRNTVRGAGAEKTSNRLDDGPDTDFASTSPKKNAGVQMAPSDQKQKDANRRDNRYGYRHSYDNNQGGLNNQGRRQRKKHKKKKDAVPVPTRNYDSPGSDWSEEEGFIDSDLENAQAGGTFGKKRCKFNELKSSEGGKEKEVQEGENSLAIKEELMQERGLVLQKTTDPTVPAIDQAKPSAKNRGPSKSLSVPSGSNETNPGSTRTLSNATIAKFAILKQRKHKKLQS